MATAVATQVPFGGLAMFRRISVAEYHRMIDAAILTEDDPIELLEGWMVLKMPRNPSHDGSIDLSLDALTQALPAGYFTRVQETLTLSDSEPEPDLAVVRGTRRDFLNRHPTAGDCELVVEVANTSLRFDRHEKSRIYARAGLRTYWIVNLEDRMLEVYTLPSGPVEAPGYGQRQDYRAGDRVPLEIGGAMAAQIPVADLLP